ncbi:DUF748 domain-containing protein [Bdellovibrio sp. 22V]|uniref:DUF748 domain-containing protein n=1 Tax=Bdellovibrio sp. 22V TaxID=3044166 RepID=UPI00254396D7|nr:DUF748 domain-containing protein [Bdellovibrio sp. 22V]WII73924.1 DUF748 domain-containing protein [Bdellovibrio sp. 22V]
MTALTKKIIYSCVGILVAYSLLGFFLVPFIIEKQIAKQVQSKLGVEPRIGDLSFNPYTFELTLSDFKIPAKQTGADIRDRLLLKKFYVNLTVYPLLKKEIRLRGVELDSAEGQFIVFKDGSINWALAPAPEPEEPEPEGNTEWILTLQNVKIANSTLDVRDYTHEIPLALPLGPLSLTATNISTSLGSQTSLKSLSIAVGEKGHLNISGSLKMKPLSAHVDLEVKSFPMDFLTAYLSDRTLLSLRTGAFDLDGKIKYEQGALSFDGNSTVHDFSLLQQNVEKPVLSWQTLGLRTISAATKPMKLSINEVRLDKFKTAIILRKDGTLNYRSFLKNPAAPTAANAISATTAQEPDKKSTAFSYLISKVVFTDGVIDFADQQIRPNFAAKVHGFSGTLGPLSEDLTQKIKTDLSGKVEAFGKFKGDGYLIPGTKKPSLDFKANFHNIELTTFTPYAGRFAGYEINQGKMFLDINYTLVNNRIRGQNRVMLDQFTLGDKVKSENSTNWPVKLGLALMKDRKGQIKFQLPVEGDVNSPSFSLGNLVWTALKNMVINIVAAPFDFIASLVGGGKDLQFILFEPGTPILLKTEEEKIQKVAQALQERPQLAVEIQGKYEQQDIEALQQIEINKMLDKKGDRSKAIRSLAKDLLPKEELKTFYKDYAAAHGEDESGLASALEKKLLATVVIPEDQLKALALSRGNVVMSLLAKNNINTERAYLLAGSKGDTEKPPQVTLSLKER